MKKSFFLICLAITSIVWHSKAQTFKDELKEVQTIWSKEKKQIVMDVLQLSNEEAAKFAPIYNEYLEARKKVAMVRGEALQTLAASNAQLDDATAQKLVSSLMKNNTNLSSLQSKTFKKMSKALSPVKAAQWWQVESYIDAEIRARLLSELPFVQPLKK
jgi:Spy/CpxP family protein refolding chaperone